MKKRARRDRPQKISEAEKEQVRARTIVGHDFGLRTDQHGRQRLKIGTYEATREYEIATSDKVVRVRKVDPLKGVSTLTEAQRAAGAKFRETFEFCAREGLPSLQWQSRVDGGKPFGGVAEQLLVAHGALRAATHALGHPEIVAVVQGMCVAGLSASDVAARTGDVRHAIVKLLKIGLDNLARHYGIAG
jgi:hypothetical protein